MAPRGSYALMLRPGIEMSERLTMLRECGFRGVAIGSVSLGEGFRVSKAQARPSVTSLFLLFVYPDVEISSTISASRLTYCLP